MSAEQLAVGLYVTMPGGIPGRIVDRQVHNHTLWWIVKSKRGQIYRVRSSKLTPR